MPCPPTPSQIQELHLPLQTDYVLGSCSCSCTGNAWILLDPSRRATGSRQNHTQWLRHKNKALQNWVSYQSQSGQWGRKMSNSSAFSHQYHLQQHIPSSVLQHSGTHPSLWRAHSAQEPNKKLTQQENVFCQFSEQSWFTNQASTEPAKEEL